MAALAGPQWLFTEEKLMNENYNGTWNFNAKDHGAYLSKYTKSSLWILCTKFHGKALLHPSSSNPCVVLRTVQIIYLMSICAVQLKLRLTFTSSIVHRPSFFYSRFSEEVWRCSKIDYFPTEEYSPDPNDSTMAIPCKLN